MQKDCFKDDLGSLQLLFDTAWELNHLDETRTQLSRMTTTLLPGIMQNYTHLAERHAPRLLSLNELKAWQEPVWVACTHWQGWALSYYSAIDDRFSFTRHEEHGISRSASDYLADGFAWWFAAYTGKPDNLKIPEIIE